MRGWIGITSVSSANSSRTSRRVASTGSSPGSIWPPAGNHIPIFESGYHFSNGPSLGLGGALSYLDVVKGLGGSPSGPVTQVTVTPPTNAGRITDTPEHMTGLVKNGNGSGDQLVDGAFDPTTADFGGFGAVFDDAVTTAGSQTLTSATANFVNSDRGLGIIGAGIPAGVTINNVNSSTSVTLSNSATVTASGVTIVIAPNVKARAAVSSESCSTSERMAPEYCTAEWSRAASSSSVARHGTARERR